ncbi:MAG: cytochrome c4 [Gammaproteobacteria bacterium]|nr:cytochrome c4 [Gammaproteobacteria bacterium]MCP4091053.1 cytochrome c4 [Gammaproteobacteria bacterium]MCP4277421.1 cytochrome c4 [Gammaproteobacteria bacterium]MCP4831518.1 cytochrome c4 [Gammaproteobacteria bacterium]MCP4927741.1 cytochrome c4 [Gammaproteobacteria bacterium]
MHSKLFMYRKWQFSLAIVAAVLSVQAFAAGDAARGKLLTDTCKGCHAVDSYANAYPAYHVPYIAGQSADYTVSALTLYRDGNRTHPTMRAQAATLSDQDIQDIAAYLSSAVKQPDPAATVRGVAPSAAVACTACHGAAGISLIPMNPYLAGQQLDYLEQAVLQYKNGDRKGPNAIAMQAQVNALAEEDLKATLAFFAAQDGLEILPMN